MRLVGMLLLIGVGVASAAPPLPSAAILLRRSGLSVGGQNLLFGRTPRVTAIEAATRALGKPLKVGSHGDCGQGDVIGFAQFAGGFELSFVKGRLSGWTEDGRAIATDKGIRVGATVAALRRAYSDLSTDPGDEKNGGLGPSFQSENGPAGWLDGIKPGAKVTGLFAGATCLPGV